MASTDASPVPRKATAFRVTFPILDNTGEPVSGAAGLDSEVDKDGAGFADCTNEATEIGSSGLYFLDITSGEMTADTVSVLVKTSTTDAKTTVLVLYPQEAGDIKVDLDTIKGQSVTAAAGVTFPTSIGTSTYAGGDTSGTGTLLTRLSSARAGYLDNLSAGAVALASTALSNVLWTSAVVSDIGQGAGSAVALAGLLTPTRAAYLDNLSEGPVAQAATALSNATWSDPFQASLADGMTNVSSIVTRTSAIKAKTDNLPSSPAAVGSAMTLTSAYDAAKTATSALGLLDTALSGHTTSGTVGGALSSASASGDPWTTVVPGAYEDGTAGAALGRLNVVPEGQPVLIVPEPATITSQTNAYVAMRDGQGAIAVGATLQFQLILPPGSDSYNTATFTSPVSDSDGMLVVALRKLTQYRARRGATSPWTPLTTGTDGTYALPQVLGTGQ